MAMFTHLSSFQLGSNGNLRTNWSNQVTGSTFYYTFTAADDPVADLENCLMCDIADAIYFDLNQVPANNTYTQADAESWGNQQVALAAWNTIQTVGLQSVHYPDTGLYVGAQVTGNWTTSGVRSGIVAPVWANSTGAAKQYLLGESTFTYVE